VHNSRAWSFAGRSRAALWRRLTYEPVLFVLRQPAYVVLLLLAAPALLHLPRSLPWPPKSARCWAGYVAVVALGYWFGTTSWTAFNPLPVSRRRLIVFLAPLALLAGLALARLWQRQRPRTVLLLALVCVALPLALAWHGSMRAEHPMRALERRVLGHYLGSVERPTVVFTDRHHVFALPFYFGGELPAGVQVRDWAISLPHHGAPGTDTLVYVQGLEVEILQKNWGDVPPACVVEPPADWQLLAEQAIPSRMRGRFLRVYRIP